TACKLGDARRQLSLIDFEAQKYGAQLVPKDKKYFKTRRLALVASVKQKTDSLVKVNLAILAQNGRTAGIEFRQHLAIAAGLSESDLAPVDEAIANAAEDKQSAPAALPALVPAPAVPALTTPPNNGPHKNSVLAATMAAKTRALLDKGDSDEALTVFLLYQAAMRRFLDASVYEKLKEAVDDARKQAEDRRQKASGVARNIQNLLDQDHPAQAYTDFRKLRDTLKAGLEQEDFRRLEAKTGQAYVEYLRAQAAAMARAQQIRTFLTNKKIEDASLEFDQSRTQLGRFLPKDTFETLQQDVHAAYATMQDKKKFCLTTAKDIQALIKRGQEAVAWGRFNDNKGLLKQYLDPAVFSALEASVVNAYRRLDARRKNAAAEAGRIDSLIDKIKIDKAHDLFEKISAALRQNLADDKRFFDLKERVENAFAAWTDEKRQAARSARQIEMFIDRKEGEKAYAAFKENAGLLKECLDPAVFKNLENAAARAKEAYAANRSAARAAAITVGKMLDKKQIEQAAALYRKTEDDFTHYLDGDSAIAVLDKRVEEATAAFQEKKRLAAATVRRIKGFIGQSRGRQALDLFDSTKAELTLSLDAKTFSSLSTLVFEANKEFIEASGRAEKAAARVRDLLVQKRIEEAGAAFDSAAGGLKTYLDPTAFNELQRQVETSDSVFQGKKKEAMQLVGTLNDLLDQKNGSLAYAQFQANKTLLTEYTTASIVSSLQARVTRADAENKANCKQAQALAARLLALLKKSSVENAYTQFDLKRDFLVRYLDPASFTKLDKALTGPYADFSQKRKKAYTLVSVLKEKIEQNQASQAYNGFFKQEEYLNKYLPATDYTAIKTQVTQAYGNSMRGRNEAHRNAAKIRGLLAGNKVAEARSLLLDSRHMLEQYLSETDFSNLQNQVSSAFDEQERKRRQVSEFADSLRTLVADNKLWDAYKNFKFTRDVLQRYLEPEAYSDLENLVVGAYNDGRAKALDKKGNL
ncbi:MAG: hypothetical protein PHC61_12000, partial [Chitinivibrionales bacterium]|nr:hypothetical protein [Chitinivibrionales bacterium]